MWCLLVSYTHLSFSILTEELIENSFASYKWKNYRYSAIISISPLYSIFLFQDGFTGEKFHIIVVRSLLLFALKKKCIFSHLPAQSSISVPSLWFVIWRRHCIFSVCSAKHLLVFSCDPGTFFSGLLFGYYRCFAYDFPQSEPSSPPCVKKHILCSFCGSVTFQSGATLKGVLSFMLPGYLLCNT